MNSQHPDSIINSLKVASPCNASWSEMTGDERRRFCEHCQKNVYNIEGMTRKEVVVLIGSYEKKTGELPCMRLKRRHDGTVVTGDCPVGLERVTKRIALAVSLILGLISSSILGVWFTRSETPEEIMGEIAVAPHVMGKVAPAYYYSMPEHSTGSLK